MRTFSGSFVRKCDRRGPVAYNFGSFCTQVRTSGTGCVRFRGHLFASESPEGKKGSEGEGGDVGSEGEGCGGGDGGDEVDDGNDGDDGDDKGGDEGPEDEPSTAARVATEIRAAVKGRRAE